MQWLASELAAHSSEGQALQAGAPGPWQGAQGPHSTCQPPGLAGAGGGRRRRAHLEDAGAGGLSHAQSAHPQLGHLVQARVVGDGAHQHRHLVLLHASTRRRQTARGKERGNHQRSVSVNVCRGCTPGCAATPAPRWPLLHPCRSPGPRYTPGAAGWAARAIVPPACAGQSRAPHGARLKRESGSPACRAAGWRLNGRQCSSKQAHGVGGRRAGWGERGVCERGAGLLLFSWPLSHVCTLPAMNFASLDRDRGGRLVLDMNSRLSTTLLKSLSVRRTRKRYSCGTGAAHAGSRSSRVCVCGGGGVGGRGGQAGWPRTKVWRGADLRGWSPFCCGCPRARGLPARLRPGLAGWHSALPSWHAAAAAVAPTARAAALWQPAGLHQSPGCLPQAEGLLLLQLRGLSGAAGCLLVCKLLTAAPA